MVGCSGSSSSGTASLLNGDAGARNDAAGSSTIGHGPNGGSNAGSPTANPTPSGGDACGADAKDDTCLSCMKQSCCSAFAACVGDDACAGLFTCAAQCRSGDEACVESCVQTHEGGLTHAQALVQCQARACAASCGGGGDANDQCLPDDAMQGANDCDGVPGRHKVRDCPGGSPGADCVLAPDGLANVYCCPG